MNRPYDDLDFEPRIADWLEGDPDVAPAAVLTTVLAAFPSIPQRRASHAPRRFQTMTTLARALVAAAIIGFAAGGALFIQRSNEALVSGQLASPTVAAPRPTVGPEASPAAAGPQGFTEAYLSELYSYGLRYPATWTMTPGTVANRSDYLPELAEGRADFYGDTMSGHGLMVTSAPVSSERTDLAAWSAFVANAVPQKFGGYLGISTCAESTRALTVDGEPANELDFICPEHDWLWVTAVHAGRAYQIAWLDDGGFDSDYLRPLLDRFLQTFSFSD